MALAAPGNGPLHIVAPVDGVILALDPDVPAARQRILWSAEGGGKDLAWRLNGRVIAGGAAVDWMPWPGRHMIELLEGQQVVDRAAIEVRGAPKRWFSAR